MSVSSESEDFHSLPSMTNDEGGTVCQASIVEESANDAENPSNYASTSTMESINVAMDDPMVTAQIIDSLLPGDGLFDDDILEELSDIDVNDDFITCLNPEIEAMGSIIAETLLCPICKKQFCLQTGEPRDLKCGHTVCSDCLPGIYSAVSEMDVVCPECKEVGNYRTIEAVPVSFTIKQIVETYSEKKIELENPKTFNRKLTILQADDETSVLGDTGTCEDHSLPIEFGCITCEQWLCGTCVCIKHSGIPKTTCKVYPIHTALAIRKNAALADLNKKIEVFEAMQVDRKAIDTSVDRLLKVMEKESKLLQTIVDRFKEKEEIYAQEKLSLRERGGKVSRTLSSLYSAKTPTQMKAALDFYFENKDFIHKEPVKNDLFNLWRQSASEVEEFWNNNQSFYVKCPKLSASGWAKVTTKSGYRKAVVKFPDLNPETDLKDAVIMETLFFDLSNQVYYAFINMDSSNRHYANVSFIVNDNPLGKIFLQKCCECENAFDECVVKYLDPSVRILTFGERSFKAPKKLVSIGELNQYKKPFSLGSIGIIGKVEDDNCIDVNNMIIYINLEDEPPKDQKLSFICNDEENWFLNLCFGEVYENLETLQAMTRTGRGNFTIQNSGITVDAEEPSDDED